MIYVDWFLKRNTSDKTKWIIPVEVLIVTIKDQNSNKMLHDSQSDGRMRDISLPNEKASLFRHAPIDDMVFFSMTKNAGKCWALKFPNRNSLQYMAETPTTIHQNMFMGIDTGHLSRQ